MSEFGKKPTAKGKDEPSAATVDDANLGVLMPAYAIGATDAAENARIARELAGDEEAIAELAAFSRLAETMLYSPPPVAAPPALAGSLRATIAAQEAVPPVAAAQQVSVATPGAPTQAANSGRRWNWPLSALAGVAVAAILLLGAVSLFLLSEIAALRDSQLDLQAQLTARDSVLLSMQNAQDSLREQASARDAILIDVVATVGEHYQMIAAQADSPANADVAWVHDSNIAILTADQFPNLEPGRVYQLWLIRDGQRSSGGLFTVDSDGSATYIFSPPEPLESFQSMGITPEPAGGSSGPTAPPVVRGEL